VQLEAQVWSAASSPLNLSAIGSERVTVGFPRACLSNSSRLGEECAGWWWNCQWRGCCQRGGGWSGFLRPLASDFAFSLGVVLMASSGSGDDESSGSLPSWLSLAVDRSVACWKTDPLVRLMLLWASINIIGVPSCPRWSETPQKPVD
jgi:hypothetical protein